MTRPTLLVVEDDAAMLDMLSASLDGDYAVRTARSGSAAIAAFEAAQPQLVLLDVGMPGMDGYETCQRLRGAGADVPVIFISGHDLLEDRLKGYEAGGDDYVVKPVQPAELLAKVAALLKAAAARSQLRHAADYAGRTAMTAMASMGEMGVLLAALRAFNECADLRRVAQAAADGLSGYGLHGVVRLHTPDGAVILSTQGEASPMEMSVVQLVAGLGRMVGYKSRLSVSYDHVTLLVSNLPVDDAERCGRLRDHLAALAEAAEGRVRAIRRENAIRRTVSAAVAALADVDSVQRRTRSATGMALEDMTHELERAYVGAALSEAQEDYMASIVRRGVDRILASMSAEIDLQQRLTAIVAELEAVTSRAP